MVLEDVWYARLFFWCAAICDEFTDGNLEYTAKRNGTNLCQFLRVMVVYTPLILLFEAAVYLCAIGALTAVPIYIIGISSYIAVLVAGAFVIGLVYGLKLLRDFNKNRAFRNAMNHEFVPTPEPDLMKTQAPGFLSLVWAWIVAQKQRVCPIIRFNTEVATS